MGKPPDIVIEIVSNIEGGELTSKRKIYAEGVRAPYYVVWDPESLLKTSRLSVFKLDGLRYTTIPEPIFPEIGLRLNFWEGEFETWTNEWLRWADLDGNLIPTGNEQRRRAEEQQIRAKDETRRANVEKRRADEERRRGDLLAAKLRELGIDPNELTESKRSENGSGESALSP